MPSRPIQISDLLVEIRDSNLVRVGSIPAPDLNLKMQPVFNGVGAWSVTLPAENKKVPLLRAPGAGIIVTNVNTGMVMISGHASKPSKRQSASDRQGMVTVAGLSDDRLLWDALAVPKPSVADFGLQDVANDVRTGNGETLIRAYVNANIGPGAPAGRKTGSVRTKVTLEAVNKNLGATLTKRPRFDKLGDLLREIAYEAGNLGFRLVQVGSNIELQVYQPTDRSAFIRLDVASGTLSDQNVEFAPPEVTRLAVAGQGEGAERQIVSVTSAESVAAEAMWGLIIEEFKDQRNTDVTQELIDAGTGILNERGFTKVAVKATPANDQTMVFMRDFFLGDKVTVVIDGQEPKSYVTEAAIVVDETGIHTAVAIGDVTDFDSASALRQTVNDNTRRIENIEQNSEPAPAESLAMTGEIKMWMLPTAPAGYLVLDGVAKSRTTYAALFALWGTTFGAGDGSTTFGIPNMKGRVPVGLDAGQTEFDTIGETGGAKTHTLTASEMPSHTHSSGSNTNGFVAHATGGSGFSAVFINDGSGEAMFYRQPASAGSNQPHNNLQPYIVINYIVKT